MHHGPSHAPASDGFTAVEFLVVLALVVILAGVGLPQMRAWVVSSELTGMANGFLAHLHFAREEAVARNLRVVLCKSADGATCATQGAWDQGFIVFHDRNANGRPDPGEDVVRRHAAQDGYLVQGNATVRDAVAYHPDGFSRLPNGGFQAGTLTFCHRAGAVPEGRQVVINAAGRPRVQRAPCL